MEKNKDILSINELLTDDTLSETSQAQKSKAILLSLDVVLEHLPPKEPVDITNEHKNKISS